MGEIGDSPLSGRALARRIIAPGVAARKWGALDSLLTNDWQSTRPSKNKGEKN